jgi:hypothetical protein
MVVRGGAVTVHVVDIETTDPIVELTGEAGELSRRHSQQRVELVRGEVDAEHETRACRVLDEDAPETRVREQAPERSFHVLLTHASISGVSREQTPHQAHAVANGTPEGFSGVVHTRSRVTAHMSV